MLLRENHRWAWIDTDGDRLGRKGAFEGKSWEMRRVLAYPQGRCVIVVLVRWFRVSSKLSPTDDYTLVPPALIMLVVIRMYCLRWKKEAVELLDGNSLEHDAASPYRRVLMAAGHVRAEESRRRFFNCMGYYRGHWTSTICSRRLRSRYFTCPCVAPYS